MKCISCGVDSKYKDRTGGRCPSCGKFFAFEPRQGGLMTDRAFQSCIDRVSSFGRVRFGAEHLYYEVCRRKRPRPIGTGWVVSTGVGAALLVAAGVLAGAPLAVIGIAGFGGVVLRNVYVYYVRTRVPIDRATFEWMWNRWTSVHGTPPGFIARKAPPARPRPVEPDLPDYSFDRAVICDKPATVDLLLANNFHFENNCAVLSIGGYPEGPFETVRAMLKRNPRLQVFALHDATFEGCAMAHRLAHDRNWFAGQGRVTDVGLRPAHAGPFRGLYQGPSPRRADSAHAITPVEAAWLEQQSLELAAIRPEQILKRLYRAVNRIEERARQGDTQGDGDFELDVYSFSDEAGDSEGAADGFG